MGKGKKRDDDTENGTRTVLVRCPECDARLRVNRDDDAQEVTCDCGATFEVAPPSKRRQAEVVEEVEKTPRRKRKKRRQDSDDASDDSGFVLFGRTPLGLVTFLLFWGVVLGGVGFGAWWGAELMFAPYQATIDAGADKARARGWTPKRALLKAGSKVKLSGWTVVVDADNPRQGTINPVGKGGALAVVLQVKVERSGHTAVESFLMANVKTVRSSESSTNWRLDLDAFERAVKADEIKLFKIVR